MGQVCKKEISDIYLPLSEDTSRLIRGSKRGGKSLKILCFRKTEKRGRHSRSKL